MVCEFFLLQIYKVALLTTIRTVSLSNAHVQHLRRGSVGMNEVGFYLRLGFYLVEVKI